MSRHVCSVTLSVVLTLAISASWAQTISGTVFHDRNANGTKDPGEEGLDAATVRVIGQRDAGGAFDQTQQTVATGAFSFNPGNGCYLLAVTDPPGWRRTFGRSDELAQGAPGYALPSGIRRYGGTTSLLANLKNGLVRDTALGDSIAVNFNTCFDTGTFFYEQAVRDRLRCVAPAATINLDESAIVGEDTEDLLIDESDGNNVFRTIERQSQLTTISIVGNDLKDHDPGANPTQAQINDAVAEIIDSRQNLQEILSALVSQIPGGDVELNTLYDNLDFNCATTSFRRDWTPIIQQVIRDVAWGQTRRVTNAEVYLDYSHEDLNGGCTGFKNQICQFIGDGIHPKNSGYQIIREKLWEALDGVNLGSKDANGASTATVDQGYLQRVLRLFPTRSEARSGAVVTDAGAALRADDAGAGAAVRLGLGTEEFRLTGFPDWYDEVVPVKMIAGVRYRTSGSVTDDFYRIEASLNDQFRPPVGHSYTPTSWLFFTPIVGGGGPNQPSEHPDFAAAKLLALPNVASYREVSATVLKNPTRGVGATKYSWPAITSSELGTTTIRVAAAPVANTPGDNYQVVVDYAYLDLYGTTKPRPAEIRQLTARVPAAGTLAIAFDELVGSELYNLYFGSLAALSSGQYDHANDLRCNIPTSVAGPGRLETTLSGSSVPSGSVYFLVTGRVDGVESPAGFRSSGVEIDRSLNRCP